MFRLVTGHDEIADSSLPRTPTPTDGEKECKVEDKESDVPSGPRCEMLMDVAVTAVFFNLNGSSVNKFEGDQIGFLFAILGPQITPESSLL